MVAIGERAAGGGVGGGESFLWTTLRVVVLAGQRDVAGSLVWWGNFLRFIPLPRVVTLSISLPSASKIPRPTDARNFTCMHPTTTTQLI